MSIEGVTSAQIIRKLRGVQEAGGAEEADASSSTGADQLDISGDARFARTLSRVQKRIQQTPEVREGKVADVKQQLESGAYDSDEVIQDVADNLASVFLGEQ